MLNWKKFFDDEKEENNDELEIEYYEKTDKKKNKLSAWFEEEKTNTKNTSKIDSDINDSDIFDEEDEDYELEKKSSILEKIKTFFKDKKTNSWFEEEAEDYKTYLERQKNERTDDHSEFEENDIFGDDFDDSSYDDEHIEKQESLLSKIKNKLSSMTTTKQNEAEEDLEEIDTYFEEELITKEEQEIKLNKYDESTITSKLETLEEFDKTEQENKSIKESLQELGIKSDTIQEVDFFTEREDRRTHPTLASMKIKRIIQDKKIEDLGNDIIENDKSTIIDSTNIKSEQITEENISEETARESKNKEDIEKLNKDFNNIKRKDNKIISKDSNSDQSTIEKAITEIKYHEENSKKDMKNYDIEINNYANEKDRRDKLKYTSVNEVLEGSNELFEDDIDKVSKKLIVNKDESSPEDIENFRKEVFKQKSSVDLVDANNKTILDDLIIETNIVEKEKESESEEINKLNENLLIIQQENQDKKDNTVEEDISIEQIAKDSEPNYPKYDDLKKEKENKDILTEYSDYNLDLEEIEELTSQNNIDSKSENTSIDSLTKEVTSTNKKELINDIDKFKEEKTYTPPKTQENNTKVEEKLEKEDTKIHYVENLYSNEVTNYFVDENSSITFGEYKIKDNGYRPVSKETIEKNQKKLEAIFEKYSNTTSNLNNTSYIEKKISSPTTKRIGKYKPTPVYSSVYGSKTITDNKTTKNNKNTSKNYFKEIASQKEATWNIELNSRIPKKQNNKEK
ncbi:hypothetical protein HZY83_04660 [Gemella sp. GH3]|uniref:hypothetical protein n=1 Tax=unclassified Gemella TaxID=2624949 RepID=UPI0015D042EC|nr:MULTISPECIES: hypothetical protein [unclassified Gemella]MBF0713973.1 hypothetical protein [Gemella sp. GH3.1]NYS50925.1 hypothetical protein [Gemella sp. GH3]